MRGQERLTLSTVGPGFSEPVDDAQRVFRLVLDAVTRPGRIVTIPADILPANDSDLSDAAAAVALALLDFETPVWLDARLRDCSGFLRFHCGSPIVSEPRASRFAFAADIGRLPPVTDFALGSDDYPDRATTLTIEVPRLRDEGPLALHGPGIRNGALFDCGLGAAFWRSRAALRPMFPLGLDLLLTCGRRLAALPRTTGVEGF